MSLPLLGGLGNEVVVIVGVLVALVVVVFAWWSTNVAETRVVGVVYLSTSHFNRLLQHLGQTPATAAAAGHPATFLAPSVNGDSVNAASQSRAAIEAERDTAPSAMAVKQENTPPGDCPSQQVDAGSTDAARTSHECRVTADGDVYVDAQTGGTHCDENCTDSGRLHSTPDGIVLEGCTHLDGRMGGVWLAGEDATEAWTAGSVVRHRRGGSLNSTTSTQPNNTDITCTCRSSLGHLTQAARQDQKSHQEESDEEEDRMRSVGEGSEGGGGVGGVSGEDGSEREGGVGEGSALETVPSDDNRGQESTASCQVCPDTPSFSTAMSEDVGATMASSSDKQRNDALKRCYRKLHDSRQCAKNTFEGTVPSSEGVHLIARRDNKGEESTPGGCSTAADTGVKRGVLRARQTATGYVTVRLKYLDDQQRDVQTRLEDTVADFKRQHFAAELSANCNVRFVHNGQELRGDSATLRSFNVVDNSVIHCWLSRPVQPAPGTGAGSTVTAAATQLDFGCLVLPLFAMLLLLVWYCRFSYHVYFSAVSTFCLVAMTLVFAVCMFVSLQFGDDAIDEVAI